MATTWVGRPLLQCCLIWNALTKDSVTTFCPALVLESKTSCVLPEGAARPGPVGWCWSSGVHSNVRSPIIRLKPFESEFRSGRRALTPITIGIRDNLASKTTFSLTVLPTPHLYTQPSTPGTLFLLRSVERLRHLQPSLCHLSRQARLHWVGRRLFMHLTSTQIL